MPAWPLALAAVLLCVWGALSAPGSSRAVALMAGTGLSALLLVRRRFGWSEWALAAPCVGFFLAPLPALMGLAVGWMTGPTDLARTVPGWILTLGTMAGGAWVVARRRRVHLDWSRGDVVALPLAGFACLIFLPNFRINGPDPVPGEFWLRGWVAQDGMYFFSLVQQILERWAAPGENPLLLGSPNRYPWLCHGALAGLLGGREPVAAVAGWWAMAWVSVCAVGTLGHELGRWWGWCRRSRDARGGPPGVGLLLAAVGLGCWVVLRRDFFAYASTQLAALGFLAGLLTLWAGSTLRPVWSAITPPRLLMAGCLGLASLLVLVLAHTLTAFLVLMTCAGAGVVAWFSRARPHPRRWVMPVAGGVAVACGWLVTTYPAAGEMDPRRMPHLRDWKEIWGLNGPLVIAALLSLAVFVRVLAHPVHRVRPMGAVAVAGLLLLAAWPTWILLGSRDPDHWARSFVYINAQRLPWLALLGAMGCLGVLGNRWAAGWIATLVWGVAVFPPVVGARVESQFYRAAPQVVGAEELELARQIRQLTPPAARIAVMGTTNWVAGLTGRAQMTREQPNLWGMGTLTAREFRRRAGLVEVLFWRSDPSVKREVARELGITHVVVPLPLPITESGKDWLETVMPAGLLVERAATRHGRLLEVVP